MGYVASISVPFELEVAGGPAVFGFPAIDGVLSVASIPADPGIPILVGGFTYWTVRTRLSSYRTMAIGLLFFAAIGLSEYRILDWRIQETIVLSYIGSRPQSIGLSDIGLRINHWLPTSDYYCLSKLYYSNNVGNG